MALHPSHSLIDLIGHTPLVRLKASPDLQEARVFAKVEYFNPGGSIKDRIAWGMIESAERQGILKPGFTLVEPTGGNTGIGLAMICAARGYKLVAVMPEGMSKERTDLLTSYGAEVVLTPAWEGMRAAVAEAQRLARQHSYFMPDQYTNPANPETHRRTTAVEIWEAMEGKVDAFVAGVGTGGTVTGVGEFLKSKNPQIKIVAVEPATSPVLSGGKPGPHRIQGIGAGFIPKILNTSILDEIARVGDEEAYQTAKNLAREEGLCVGISSGANVFTARGLAKRLGKGKNIVTVLPDSGERYLSMEKYFE
jgi:cysteine synthase A